MNTVHLSFPALAAVVYLIYITLRALYNIFLHPLRKYPGPLVHRVTRTYSAYKQLKGIYHQHTRDLHRRYGPVVRIGPNELSYIKEQAWADIYGHKTASRTVDLPKDPEQRREEENGGVNILTANYEDHRRLRRIQTPMFSERAIADQEQFITGYVNLLVTRLREHANSSTVIDIARWYNFTTFDILGELAFGKSFDCLKNSSSDLWIETIPLLLKDGSYWFASNKFPWPLNKLIYRLSPSETRNSRARRSILAERKVCERVDRSEEMKKIDFMSHILKHDNEKGRMTMADIQVNAVVLIIAGSETTATLLSGLTYLILKQREHFDKLSKLIRTTFPEEKDITVLELNKLEYLNAVINESFRLYPPVPIGLRRVTLKGGSMICGEVIPEFTAVSVANLAANTDPTNWTDPERFVPERWYKGDKCPERYRHDHRKVMQSFSYGPRNCIGKNMATAEMRIILSHVLWNFDMELESTNMDWMAQKVYTLWDKMPLMVRITPRKF